MNEPQILFTMRVSPHIFLMYIFYRCLIVIRVFMSFLNKR